MKAKLFTISAITALCALSGAAQEQSAPADTLAVINNAQILTVTRTPAGSNITVVGTDKDDEFYYSFSTEQPDSMSIAGRDEEWGLSLPFLRDTKRRTSEVIWFGHTQLGICFPLDAPKGLDQSVDLAIGKIVGLNYTPWEKGPTFSFGAGIFAQKFALHGGNMFGMEGKSLVMQQLPEGAHDTHVRLFNFGLQVPFSVTQTLTHDFKFSAGVAMKFNTYTTASNKYTLDNRSYEQSFKGLQQRILTCDIFAAIGWEECAIYCRYSPVSIFKSGNGPQFDVISFGINVGF